MRGLVMGTRLRRMGSRRSSGLSYELTRFLHGSDGTGRRARGKIWASDQSLGCSSVPLFLRRLLGPGLWTNKTNNSDMQY
jgi:hypothetical protein